MPALTVHYGVGKIDVTRDGKTVDIAGLSTPQRDRLIANTVRSVCNVYAYLPVDRDPRGGRHA